jgi:hypothetical protein
LKVGFPAGEEAQADDCAWADIVVSGVAVSGACAARVIDVSSLQESGAAAIWADGRVETVKGVRGVRPWAAVNGR